MEKRNRLRRDSDPPAASAGERLEALRRRVDARARQRGQAADAREDAEDARAVQRQAEGTREVPVEDAAQPTSKEDDKIHFQGRPIFTDVAGCIATSVPAATAAAASYESWHTAATTAFAPSALGER